MNTEKLLNDLVWAITNRPCAPNLVCQVGFVGDRVVCLKKYNTPHGFRPVAELRPSQMNNGMTPAQWTQLGAKLAVALNGVREMVRNQDKDKVDKPDGASAGEEYKAGVLSAVGEFLSSRDRQEKQHRCKKQEQRRLW